MLSFRKQAECDLSLNLRLPSTFVHKRSHLPGLPLHFLLLIGLHCGLCHGQRIESIQQCGAHCNQGLSCKLSPFLSLEPCRKLPKGLRDSVSLNMSVSTVMRCEGHRQCSLLLQVSGSLLMNEHVKGVSICAVAAGMMERCRTHVFPKAALKQLSTQQVEVQDSCFGVGVGQDIHVTLKTKPEFCHLSVSKIHRVPGCSHVDLQRNFPECIAGSITYQLDAGRKQLRVSVADMLEDADYNLRLCYKGFVCRSAGVQTLLKKEDPVKTAVLQYARPLPCLCIEGWSSVFDAPRTHVCPFKNNQEELWAGVAFDSVEQILSWEPACKTEVTVSLCQKTGQSSCQNLANASQPASSTKVLFSTVDPHPDLCMKFTTKEGSWIKCPFAASGLTAWDIEVTVEQGRAQLVVTSKIRPTLLLSLCRKTGPSICEENRDIITFSAGKYQSVVPDLAFRVCGGENCCVQARRVDVKYAATVLLCDFKSSLLHPSSHWDSVWIIAPALGLLSALLVAFLVTGAALTTMIFYQRQSDVPPCCGISAAQHSAAQSSHSPAAGVGSSASPHKTPQSTSYLYPAVEDVPNFENNEKTNLLNWVKKDSAV